MNVRTIETDGRAATTGRYMVDMVNKYHTDMYPYAHMSLLEVYDIIKRIPFRPDPPDEETLMRPCYTMNSTGTGGDCDDKSIALASYCMLRGIPYRFIAVRRSDMNSLHHVFPQCYINGKWITADPTYPFCQFGRERERYADRLIIS